MRLHIHIYEKSINCKVKTANTLLFLISFFVLTISSPVKSFAQSVISGRVFDQQGNPVSGATVRAGSGAPSTVTLEDGSFTIRVKEDEQVLQFSYIGMRNLEVTIKGRSDWNITMETEGQSLDEVVVTGYGTQTRSNITGSISKLNSDVLQNIPFSNATSALQGTLPGVRVQSISGQPGATPRVIIRGGTSINNPNGATPLYIVDGVIQDEIGFINQNDIESLQVLKDATATAIYGARGSNGVVIIQTKSGTAHRTEVSYRYDATFSNPNRKYDLLSARDFIYFQRLGLAASGEKNPANLNQLTQALSAGIGNDLTNQTAYTTQYLNASNEHKLNEGWESMPDPLDPVKTIIFRGTDFQNILFKTGLSHNHSISIRGGNDGVLFSATASYLANEGIALGTDYQRINFNLNGSMKVKPNLNIGGRLYYAKTWDTQLPQGGLTANPPNHIFFRSSIAIAPTTKRTFEDGTTAPGQLQQTGNPEYIINTFDAKNAQDDLTLVLNSEWKIAEGLTFKPQISYTKITNDSRLFTKAFLNGPTTLIDSRNSTGSARTQQQMQMDAVLSYLKDFGTKHHLNAYAGYSYFGRNVSALSAAGRGAATDLIVTLNAAGEPVAVSGSETQMAIYGIFSSINYDYGDKYLLTMNARYDGASNLGKNKWGLFPGVSVGWNIHRENFWADWVSTEWMKLKLRASYGVNGNISGLTPYQAQGSYAVSEIYDGNSAIRSSVLPNESLVWEESKTLNGGLDIGLFNERVALIADVYRRVTTNLLTDLDLPPSAGISNILTNLGSLENRGVELELVGKVFPASAPFRWDITFNAAKVKNKILRLPDNGVLNNRVGGVNIWSDELQDYAWFGGLQEGGRIGDLFAYRQIGVYATDEEAANAPQDQLVPAADKTKRGGDVIWDDRDGNGIIDARDRAYMGNTYPSWTGGMSTTISYKNFSLLIRTDYTIGHTIYNVTLAGYVGQFGGQSNLSTLVLNSWQKQGDVTDIPRFYWADQNVNSNINRGNSYYYEKGDFLNIREVTFSYNLSSPVLSKIGVSSVGFNVTANNLYYFTRYRGLNPEDGGTDSGRYPIPRNIILGLKLFM